MPNPYYADDAITLYHGDCIDLAHTWTQADVLITDPPYGLDAALTKSPKFKRETAQPAWDKTLEVRDAALAAWQAAGRENYAVFGSPARMDAAPPFREFPLVWDKNLLGMGDTRFPWGRGYELIFIFGAGWKGRRSHSILRVPYSSSVASQVGHPTPKPVPLMELIIEKAPQGVIADPFAGSGSTLVAAKRQGRTAIGVELDERYCEIAASRLAQDVLPLGF